MKDYHCSLLGPPAAICGRFAFHWGPIVIETQQEMPTRGLRSFSERVDPETTDQVSDIKQSMISGHLNIGGKWPL